MRWITRGTIIATVVVLCPLGISQLTATEINGGTNKADLDPVTASLRRAEGLKIDDVIHAFGHVEPADLVHVSMPRHTAPVTEVLVNQGDLVSAGQVLVRIDRTDIHRDLLQAEAHLTAARADVSIAHSNLKVADTDIAQRKAELERLERLAKTGASSETQRQDAHRALQKAISEREAASARLTSAQANQTLAKLEVEHVKSLTKQMDIRATVSGRVTEVTVEQGTTPAIDTAVITLAADDIMEAVLAVPPFTLTNVAVGQPVRLWTPDGQLIKTNVSQIIPSISSTEGLARVAVRLPDGRSDLAGSSLRGEIIVDQRRAIIVPTSALVALDTGPGVLRVVNERTVATPVQFSMRPGGSEAEITSGLSEGSTYVAIASPLLRSGQSVSRSGRLDNVRIKQTAALQLSLEQR
ncbi:efflux RND transporter periplasmic adaptor subunit [Thalassobacter stenotrophicus]|uniref:efflux RND transporter periplasmic adaptor subunit n=1 Tax=Thalassobacter stenotrophicus TaxID=266809 RepID=UPI002DDCE76E|nr:efflux RND transporter periplasmic adaptor subunit [Thalassobacter stenotrophicus]